MKYKHKMGTIVPIQKSRFLSLAFSKKAIGLPIIFLLIFIQVNIGAQNEFLKEKDVRVKMSDGVHLAMDVYRPVIGKNFPIIMIRTPYKKENLSIIANFFAPLGYGVVIQDTRGKYASEGTFVPFIQEKKDSLDTLDWIMRQPWSNGKIGIWGASYLGYCGLIIAPENHPGLKTIINLSGVAGSYSFVFPGGVLHLMAMLPWLYTFDGPGQLSLSDIDVHELYKFTPLCGVMASIENKGSFWNMLCKHYTHDNFHQDMSISHRYSDIDIPMLHITGLNDWLYRGVLEVYNGIIDASKLKKKATFQQLILGPWYHNQEFTDETQVGEEDFGQEARMGVEKILQICLKWFDYWLKNVKNNIIDEPKVKIFVMGRNEWIDAAEWPLPDIEYQTWYLDSKKGANSLSGDGKLAKKLSDKGRFDRYTFDPMDPVPTVGGINYHFFKDNLGIKDQRLVEERKDVLIYTSDPLMKDIEIIGPMKAVIYASTEGKDTDFTAKLVEVRPDGYVRIIEDGIIRGSFRNSFEKPELMEPGRIYKLTIDLGATAIMIKKGCRLRLEISSSNFPKYARNPNTGQNPLEAVKFNKVVQKVYHSSKYPSHLVLPVRKK